MFELLILLIVILAIWMAWRPIQPSAVEHVEPRIMRGPGRSIVFDGYKVVQEDGSMNHYLAPEIVRDYLDYIGHE
jgi:hypothetical protein